eukprot:1075473-Amphidinium_carterae.1
MAGLCTSAGRGLLWLTTARGGRTNTARIGAAHQHVRIYEPLLVALAEELFIIHDPASRLCPLGYATSSLHSQRRHHAGVTEGRGSQAVPVVTLLPGLTVHTRRLVQLFARIVGEMLARAITALKVAGNGGSGKF